jgi:hypothetical protein
MREKKIHKDSTIEHKTQIDEIGFKFNSFKNQIEMM